MPNLIDKGTWVEIERIVLAAGERAPQVPDDTQRVPLVMRVKGFLMAAATVGTEVEVVTAAGRVSRGMLREANPAYSHTFGSPIGALAGIGGEVRAMLRDQGRIR